MNSTAVTVTWISTSLNGSVVDHYTVHYSRLNGSGNFACSSGTVTFPASASSGVVSGLQEGQQYQFSVSVSLLIDGQTYTSTPGEPVNAMTGKHDLCIAKCLLTLFEMFYLSNVNFNNSEHKQQCLYHYISEPSANIIYSVYYSLAVILPTISNLILFELLCWSGCSISDNDYITDW